MSLWKVTWAVARKELRAGFRDRQTWIYSVVLPLAMYPLLFWVMIQAQQVISGKRDATRVEVTVHWEPGREALGERLWEELGKDPDAEATEADAAASPDAETSASLDADEITTSDSVEPEDLRKLVLTRSSHGSADEAQEALSEADSGIDLLVWLPAQSDANSSPGVELHYDSSRPRGRLAAERVEAQLSELGRTLRAEAIETADRDPEDLDALDWRSVNVASSSDVGSFMLSLMLPMMMVIMTVLGAFYPAIDMTAGERERNTEETTRLIPAPRAAVHLGKVAAVSATAMLATVANLAGMALAAGHLMGMLGENISIELPWVNLALMLPLALTFVVFASVVLVSAASLTDTFKQGQSLLGTVQMVFMLPSMATVLPGLVLSPGMAAIPIVGLAIAYRDILRAEDLGDLPWINIALCGAFTLIYAGAALWLGLRILGAEQLGGSDAGWGARLKAALTGPAAPR